jgi:flagellar FliL protein
MAEEEIQESNAGSKTPPKKKGSFKMILIVIVAAALAGGAGYYFYGKNITAARPQSKPSRDEARDDRRDDRKDDRRDDVRADAGPIVSLDPFVMNVSGSSSRFVKMAIALQVRDAKAIEDVKKMTPAIRDAMIGVLGSKAPETFMDVAGRDQMKKELFDSADRFFKRGDLQAVYITDIIMQ